MNKTFVLRIAILQSEAPADASSGLALLDGEYATNVVVPISYALARRRAGGGEFDGALHITNFRLVLQRTGRGKVCRVANPVVVIYIRTFFVDEDKEIFCFVS